MKSSIRHGGLLRCDMVTVTRDAYTKPCQEIFVTYSVASLARVQAASAGWERVKVKLVKWPGHPPAGDNTKVDLCPTCSALVMSIEEHQKLKDQHKAEKLAKKNAPKKTPEPSKPSEPKRKRKPRGEPASP